MLQNPEILVGCSFTWITDHKGLTHLLTQKNLSSHQAWQIARYLSLTSKSNISQVWIISQQMPCLICIQMIEQAWLDHLQSTLNLIRICGVFIGCSGHFFSSFCQGRGFGHTTFASDLFSMSQSWRIASVCRSYGSRYTACGLSFHLPP